MKTKRIAEYGILIALALVLGYIESLLPAFFYVPGMKLGLTNVIVLIALYRMDDLSAFTINLIRIILVALLFGSMVSLWYSLAGGIFSTLVMILLKRSNQFSTIVVSICGGVAHNIGQILVAMLLMRTMAVGWYLAVLWFSGMITGALIGLIGAEAVKRLPKHKSDVPKEQKGNA